MGILRSRVFTYTQTLMFFYSFVYLSVPAPAPAFANNNFQSLWNRDTRLQPLYLFLNQKALPLCRVVLIDGADDSLFQTGYLAEGEDGVNQCQVLTGFSLSFKEIKNATEVYPQLQGQLNPLQQQVGDFWLHYMVSEDYEILTLPSDKSTSHYRHLSDANVSELVNAGHHFKLPNATGIDDYSTGSFQELTDYHNSSLSMISPYLFYLCMKDIDADQCSHMTVESFNSPTPSHHEDQYCPPGTYRADENCKGASYSRTFGNRVTDETNVTTCFLCDDGQYQYAFEPDKENPSYEALPSSLCECKSPTSCKSPFTEVQSYTSQHDRVCDCDGSTRFIYTPPSNITKDFKFAPAIENDEKVGNVTLVDATPPYKGFYLHYDFACMVSQIPCLAQADNEETVWGVSFAEDDSNTCYSLIAANGSDGTEWRVEKASALPVTIQYLSTQSSSEYFLSSTPSLQSSSVGQPSPEYFVTLTPSHLFPVFSKTNNPVTGDMSQSQVITFTTPVLDSSEYSTTIMNLQTASVDNTVDSPAPTSSEYFLTSTPSLQSSAAGQPPPEYFVTLTSSHLFPVFSKTNSPVTGDISQSQVITFTTPVLDSSEYSATIMSLQTASVDNTVDSPAPTSSEYFLTSTPSLQSSAAGQPPPEYFVTLTSSHLFPVFSKTNSPVTGDMSQSQVITLTTPALNSSEYPVIIMNSQIVSVDNTVGLPAPTESHFLNRSSGIIVYASGVVILSVVVIVTGVVLYTAIRHTNSRILRNAAAATPSTAAFIEDHLVSDLNPSYNGHQNRDIFPGYETIQYPDYDHVHH